MRVEYPVALDNDYAIWSAFGNHYWPAVYIVDAEGRIRYHHFGEGDYDECEWIIQQLLREAGSEGIDDDLVSVDRGGLRGAADWANLRSPETYLGYEQAAELRVSRRCRVRRASRLRRARVVAAQPLGPLRRLDGRAAGERAERSRRADRLPLPRPRRPPRPALASGHGRPVPRAARRRSLPAPPTGWTSTTRAAEPSSNPRLYQLIRQPGSIDDRTFEITFDRPRRRGLRLHLRLAVAGDVLVVLDVVATEQEAEVICGLLRSAGIACLTRQTNVGAGASDGLTVAGPYEVVVRAEDLEAAREVA